MGNIFVLAAAQRAAVLFFCVGRIRKTWCILLLSGIAGLGFMGGAAQAADEDVILSKKLQQSREQTMGQGRGVLWTLPDLATQYQPYHSTPALQAALRAQQEGRFLEALILLEEAGKSVQPGTDAREEIDLLRSSFLLQGQQSRQALELLAPLLGKNRHAADAWVLAAMAHLQQGQVQEALEAAQKAHDSADGMLPNLALSYALQGAGRLAEAHEAIHAFNARASDAGAPQAIALAREAELALMLDNIQSARVLVAQAQESWAANPYVVAVDGLIDLMEGNAAEAKGEFEAVLHYDPKDTKALLGLGLAEIKLGNLPNGLKKLQEANDATPGNALIITYLGRVQQQSGQAEAAMESWYRAQQADSKDPIPWLYQAQAELQANRPLEAQASLREAQARTGYRSVYRGAHLLREDEQLLQANLAEAQRQLGLESLAFHTLADSASEKTAATLRNQADLLQGQRFGESARRSLLLQSLFGEKPGNLPAALDVYGDGAGQTGATTPQHGAVSGLGAQQASYNSYDALFSPRTMLEADAVTGSKNSNGEQIRLGVGNDTLGLGLAQLQFKTDGFAPFENLDNRAGQAIVQWRPIQSTQVFVSHQTFNSERGETFFPGSAIGNYAAIIDDSKVTRLGLRHSLTDDSELRGLWSHQQTTQLVNYFDLVTQLNTNYPTAGSSSAHSVELQYRRSGADYATQWGVQDTRGQLIFPTSSINFTRNAQQVYAAWQQTLNPSWQLEAGLGWGKIDNRDNLKTYGDSSTHLTDWLPRLGVVYTPDSVTHVRLAAWQGLGVYTVGDATLVPVTLAGVLLARPDDNGKLVKAVSLGGDRQLNSTLLLAADTQYRKTGDPFIDYGTTQQLLLKQQVHESRLSLHWQPEGKPWIASLGYDHELTQHDLQGLPLDSVLEQHLRQQQLALRWFASAQWTADMAWSHNRVVGTYTLYDPSYNQIYPAYHDSFNQLDADLSWQFNRTSSLTTGVRNATDKRAQYTEIDPLNPRFSNGRLVYARLKLAW